LTKLHHFNFGLPF